MSRPSRRARISIALIVVGGFVVPTKATHAQSTPIAAVSNSTRDAQLIAYARMNGVKTPRSR